MIHSFQFRIEHPDAGRRLDEFFAARFGGLSRMRIASLIEAGVCFVNGAVARAGYRVIVGDTVDVSLDDAAPTSMSPERIPLEVIYEDEHLVVVVKPAGILVHPTMSVKTGTLANALAYHLNKSRIEDGVWMLDSRSSIPDPQPVIRPGLVHRLDRATSGLIVIAKTPRALAVLSRHFRKRLVEKRYLSLVSGVVEQDAGSINAPIGRDPDQRPHWRVMDGGRHAETKFRVLERLARASLLELEPVTGRTNQLRIHCAGVGHPIIGDEMYGMSNSESDPQVETVARPSRILGLESGRLCLHASSLAFHHPVGGDWMQFVSSLPDEFKRIVDQNREE
ncbi:MAG TPA: RluA family pseudouridine synthase [Blastocatellia bacterium]|nr:RluA family pseudouridine synthase [Blastocatellia bacterium]